MAHVSETRTSRPLTATEYAAEANSAELARMVALYKWTACKHNRVAPWCDAYKCLACGSRIYALTSRNRATAGR